MLACLSRRTGLLCSSCMTPAHPLRGPPSTGSGCPIACNVNLRKGGFDLMPSERLSGKGRGNGGGTGVLGTLDHFSGSRDVVGSRPKPPPVPFFFSVAAAAPVMIPIWTTRNRILNRSTRLTFSSSCRRWLAQNKRAVGLSLGDDPSSPSVKALRSSRSASPPFWISRKSRLSRILSSCRFSLEIS